MKFITINRTRRRFPSSLRENLYFEAQVLPGRPLRRFAPLSGSLEPKTISAKIEKMQIPLAFEFGGLSARPSPNSTTLIELLFASTDNVNSNFLVYVLRVIANRSR